MGRSRPASEREGEREKCLRWSFVLYCIGSLGSVRTRLTHASHNLRRCFSLFCFRKNETQPNDAVLWLVNWNVKYNNHVNQKRLKMMEKKIFTTTRESGRPLNVNLSSSSDRKWLFIVNQNRLTLTRGPQQWRDFIFKCSRYSGS